MPMREVKSTKLICLKGLLFLVASVLATASLIVRHPELLTALLVIIATWCFARFYYFAFYVIERYLDPGFRFNGLFSLMTHVVCDFSSNKRRNAGRNPNQLSK